VILTAVFLAALVTAVPAVYLLWYLPRNTDSDKDGLSNWDEVHVYKTDPNSADTDEDGLSDGLEVLKYRTNPLASDTDSDGLLDGAEISLRADPNSPSIYPYLTKARQAIKILTEGVRKIRTNYVALEGMDLTAGRDITKDLNNLRSRTESFQADLQSAIQCIDLYESAETEIARTLTGLVKIWRDNSLLKESRLEKLREYNQLHRSEPAVDIAEAKGTLAYHINERQEAELLSFDQHQDNQTLQVLQIMCREATGMCNRLRQLLEVGRLIYKAANENADIYMKFWQQFLGKVSDYSLPGYAGLLELQRALKEAREQLQSHLQPSQQDLNETGKTYTSLDFEYSMQPRNRPVLQKLLNSLPNQERAQLLRVIAEDHSEYGLIQLNDILDESRDYLEPVSANIRKALGRGINDLVILCTIVNDVASPSHVGTMRDKHHGYPSECNYSLILSDKQTADNREYAIALHKRIESLKFAFSQYVVGSTREMWKRRTAGGFSQGVILFNTAFTLDGRYAQTGYIYLIGNEGITQGRWPLVPVANELHLLLNGEPIPWSSYIEKFPGVLISFASFLDGNLPTIHKIYTR